ncbi:MAG: DUF4974 domain-containing protein [Draconibacterium sp.]
MKEELLIKFLNNQCTDDELDEIIQWLNSGTFPEKDKSIVYNDWKSFKEEDGVTKFENYDTLLDKIHHKINTQQSKQSNINTGKLSISKLTTWITRAAAILLIPVLGFLFYTLSDKAPTTVEADDLIIRFVELSAPIGSRTKMELSDGTVVHLNVGSKLIYPMVFTGSTREVTLSGEGYFDVEHNPEKPFIVKTEKLDVKVLGTSFNVSAYPNDDNVETTLVKGKVTLEKRENSGASQSIGSMVPGQHVEYNTKTGAILSVKGNVEQYTGWKEGKLVFKNASVSDVASKLSRMFNVEIEIGDDIKDYTYSVTFVDEPLFQILDLMTMATPIEYKTFPRKKLADGTFSKQKIVITKRKL